MVLTGGMCEWISYIKRIEFYSSGASEHSISPTGKDCESTIPPGPVVELPERSITKFLGRASVPD